MFAGVRIPYGGSPPPAIDLQDPLSPGASIEPDFVAAHRLKPTECYVIRRGTVGLARRIVVTGAVELK